MDGILPPPNPYTSSNDYTVVEPTIPTPLENSIGTLDASDGNKPIFIDETLPLVAKPREIDGIVYMCSLCNPINVRI